MAVSGFRSRTKSAQSGHARPNPHGSQKKKTHASKNADTQTQKESLIPPLGIDRPREVVLAVLRRVREKEAYANLFLATALKSAHLAGRDAAFATELCYGTLRMQGNLDAIIERAANRPLREISGDLLDILRLGTYQLLFTRVEAHAAVDTSVRAAEGRRFDYAKGFVNATLRTVGRSPLSTWMDILLEHAGDAPYAALAIKNAHPVWIAQSFARALSWHNPHLRDHPHALSAELDSALHADSQRPIVHLVARPGEITAEELALITGGEEGKYSPYAVYLPEGSPSDVEPVRQGLAGVQDEGSQIIAYAFVHAPVTGVDRGRWLDLCAGPGGKATLIGALARIQGAQVDAVEPLAHRAELVRTSVRDFPVTVHTVDGRDPDLAPGFDRVLVDAPCSGLGALRRRPEARWRKKETDIAQLAELQKELLRSAIRLTRPGGIIIYSTCSPDLRETREVVDSVLHDPGNSSIRVTELSARDLVPMMSFPDSPELSVQLWPHIQGTDAMFFALLKVERHAET